MKLATLLGGSAAQAICLLGMLSGACSFDGDVVASNTMPLAPDASTTVDRVTDGLIALYTFDGEVVGEIADVSGFGTPLDLAVVGGGDYEVTADGWNLRGDTLISSKAPALKIVEECSQSNAISIEALTRNSTTPAVFSGSLNNWNPDYTLNLGDELQSTGLSRSWHGEYGLLAIYRRDLSAEEAMQNFRAGR